MIITGKTALTTSERHGICSVPPDNADVERTNPEAARLPSDAHRAHRGSCRRSLSPGLGENNVGTAGTAEAELGRCAAVLKDRCGHRFPGRVRINAFFAVIANSRATQSSGVSRSSARGDDLRWIGERVV